MKFLYCLKNASTFANSRFVFYAGTSNGGPVESPEGRGSKSMESSKKKKVAGDAIGKFDRMIARINRDRKPIDKKTVRTIEGNGEFTPGATYQAKERLSARCLDEDNENFTKVVGMVEKNDVVTVVEENGGVTRKTAGGKEYVKVLDENGFAVYVLQDSLVKVSMGSNETSREGVGEGMKERRALLEALKYVYQALKAKYGIDVGHPTAVADLFKIHDTQKFPDGATVAFEPEDNGQIVIKYNDPTDGDVEALYPFPKTTHGMNHQVKDLWADATEYMRERRKLGGQPGANDDLAKLDGSANKPDVEPEAASPQPEVIPQPTPEIAWEKVPLYPGTGVEIEGAATLYDLDGKEFGTRYPHRTEFTGADAKYLGYSREERRRMDLTGEGGLFNVTVNGKNIVRAPWDSQLYVPVMFHLGGKPDQPGYVALGDTRLMGDILAKFEAEVRQAAENAAASAFRDSVPSPATVPVVRTIPLGTEGRDPAEVNTIVRKFTRMDEEKWASLPRVFDDSVKSPKDRQIDPKAQVRLPAGDIIEGFDTAHTIHGPVMIVDGERYVPVQYSLQSDADGKPAPKGIGYVLSYSVLQSEEKPDGNPPEVLVMNEKQK